MKPMTMLMAALLAAACFSCGDDRTVLETNQALWQEQRADTYRYHYTRSCFCPSPYEVDIQVVNGVATLVVDTETGDVLDQGEHPDFFVTVDDLFAKARDAIAQADAWEIEFDPGLGYPTRIFVDSILDAVDDEVTHGAGNYAAVGVDMPDNFGDACADDPGVCRAPYSCLEVPVPEFGDDLHAMCTSACKTDFDCPVWISPQASPCPGMLNGFCREGFCNFTRCD
jgi:hypothetical protein